MKILTRSFTYATKTLVFFSLYIMFAALASAGGTGGLPWEAPLEKLVDSITGPVAMSVSLLAFAAAMMMFFRGGEMSDFTQKMVILVMITSGLLFVSGLLSKLFGISGALI